MDDFIISNTNDFIDINGIQSNCSEATKKIWNFTNIILNLETPELYAIYKNILRMNYTKYQYIDFNETIPLQISSYYKHFSYSSKLWIATLK